MANTSDLYKELAILETLLNEYCKMGDSVSRETKRAVLKRINEIKEALEI